MDSGLPCWILDQPQSHKMADNELNSPPSTPQTPTPRKQRQQRTTTRTNSKSLSKTTDTALLNYIAMPEWFTKFSQVCNSNHGLFGTPGSSLRRQVQNRHDFLLRLEESDSEAFTELLRDHDILETRREDHQQQQQQHQEEVEADN